MPESSFFYHMNIEGDLFIQQWILEILRNDLLTWFAVGETYHPPSPPELKKCLQQPDCKALLPIYRCLAGYVHKGHGICENKCISPDKDKTALYFFGYCVLTKRKYCSHNLGNSSKFHHKRDTFGSDFHVCRSTWNCLRMIFESISVALIISRIRPYNLKNLCRSVSNVKMKLSKCLFLPFTQSFHWNDLLYESNVVIVLCSIFPHRNVSPEMRFWGRDSIIENMEWSLPPLPSIFPSPMNNHPKFLFFFKYLSNTWSW